MISFAFPWLVYFYFFKSFFTERFTLILSVNKTCYVTFALGLAIVTVNFSSSHSPTEKQSINIFWLKFQPYRMVKYTKTIHRLLLSNFVSFFDHFVELQFKVRV